ncbi:hypothetical protein HPB50_016112 [Hyalomma asiaticum]|uniref:Uncharacterized protein n=1 Tax=Hyalomma asiaticum TaxID=266040 RepID=A0ACB7SWX8_HYAAI|nr:hypothetical protein HPB50_016112 [Hyalomma asiaticum]
MVPRHDLHTIVNTVSVPNGWARLEAPDFDGVVFATTSVKKEPFALLHEKVLMFATDCADTVTARLYFRGKERKDVAVRSVKEVADAFRYSDSAILCKGAMDQAEFDNNYSKDITCHLKRSVDIAYGIVLSRSCSGTVSKEGAVCVACRYLRKSLQSRKSWLKTRKPVKRNITKHLKLARQRTKHLASRASTLQQMVSAMKNANSKITEDALKSKLETLPSKQKEAAMHMFAAAKRKGMRGMAYSKSWILECVIMKMKGPKLYEHMRKQNILTLPAKSTLSNYLKSYRTGFGFNPKIFEVIKEKTSTMDNFKRHGGLLVDEMKLSENLAVTSGALIEGFVDLGSFTPDSDKHAVCDHGMVICFVPFVGKWTQILAVFATHGNVKGDLLAKIMTEAVILAENAGLFVDFITSDGASWNRKMWSLMGIGATTTLTKCKVQHPVDSSRSLHFVSDFPHLIKCLRNGLLKSSFNTPVGEVSLRPLRKALELDGSNVTLQAMPGITSSHTNPNNFEKMRVSFAFQVFGDKVLNGLRLYETELERNCGSIQPVLIFFG